MAIDLVTIEKAQGIAFAKANFSETILAILANKGVDTFKDVLLYDGELDFSQYYGYVFSSQGNIFNFHKGLSKMRNITGLAMKYDNFNIPFSNSNEIQYYDIANFPDLEKLVYTYVQTTFDKGFLFGSLTGLPLKHLELYRSGDSITGTLASVSTLEYFVLGGGTNIILPVLGNNINLEYIKIGVSPLYTIPKLGNLRNLTKLTDFIASSADGSVGSSASITNHILAELLLAKQNNGLLETVNLTGFSAPSGQGVTDKSSLIAEGVSVTTS